MKVAIVLKNADFTEGRGPMIFHKVFSTFEKAEAYVMKQDGVFGSKQYKQKYAESDEYYYNGYDIEMMEVE